MINVLNEHIKVIFFCGLMLTLCDVSRAELFSNLDSLPTDSNIFEKPGTVKISSFVVGNAEHPLRLLQGEVANMHISKPNGNVFEPYIIRSRGIHSFIDAHSAPQIWLNHMPIQYTQMISPWDIQQLHAKVGVADNVRQGLRSLQGAIHIESHLNHDDDKAAWRVQYQNVLSTEFIDRQTPVLDAKSFIANGGNDFGSNHDFQDEISQNALSQLHRVAITQRWHNTSISGSGQLRFAEGVLKPTKSNRLHGLLDIQQTLWQERVKLSWQGRWYDGEHNYGEPRAFFYAQRFMPTSPIKDPDNAEFGGYFQQNLFDIYNPVSIVEQVGSVGQDRGNIQQLSGEIRILPNTQIEGFYGLEQYQHEAHFWAPATSFYRGAWSNGHSDRKSEDFNNAFLRVSVQQKNKLGPLGITTTLGYDHQEVDHLLQFKDGRDFPTMVTDQTQPESGAFFSEHEDGYAYRLINFFGKVEAEKNNIGRVSLQVARSGSSRLGSNNRWAWLYSLQSELNLNRIFKAKPENIWLLSMALGRNMAQPPADNLANYVFDQLGSVYAYGNFRDFPFIRHDENQDLSPEKRFEWEMSLQRGFLSNRLLISYSVFRGVSSDLIGQMQIDRPPSLTGLIWQNLYGITNKGWEISAQWQIKNAEKIKWKARMNAFKFRSVLSTFPPGFRNIGGRCGCGGRPHSPQHVFADEALGNIRVWKEIYSTENGRYDEVDINRDNVIDYKDQTIAGNAYPKWFLGLTQDITIGKINMNFRFRGAFGHRLVNVDRLYFEVPNATNSHNIVKTKYYEGRSTWRNVFSERFAERSSYLMLDQFIFNYDIALNRQSFLKKLSIFFGGRNVWTLTRYSGLNPEPRYQDIRFEPDGSIQPNQDLSNRVLNSGFENEFSFPFTRSWFVGIHAHF